jgi:N-acylneuraminate cytidylyltransferase
MTNIIAIIPARAGSKRIPNKNIKMFLGKEIVRYPIEALLGVDYIEDIIVSTDSNEIKNIAVNSGASVPFMRSAEKSDDFSTTFDVIEEVMNKCAKKYDYICCVYPTSAFVTDQMLIEAIDLLFKTPNATSIVSVLEYSHPIQRSLKNECGFLVSNTPEFYNERSQDLEVNYHDAGQFYVFNTKQALLEKKLITNKCIPYVINPNEAHDIDTIDDWELAELKFKYKKMKQTK